MVREQTSRAQTTFPQQESLTQRDRQRMTEFSLRNRAKPSLALHGGPFPLVLACLFTRVGLDRGVLMHAQPRVPQLGMSPPSFCPAHCFPAHCCPAAVTTHARHKHVCTSPLIGQHVCYNACARSACQDSVQHETRDTAAATCTPRTGWPCVPRQGDLSPGKVAQPTKQAPCMLAMHSTLPDCHKPTPPASSSQGLRTRSTHSQGVSLLTLLCALIPTHTHKLLSPLPQFEPLLYDPLTCSTTTATVAAKVPG